MTIYRLTIEAINGDDNGRLPELRRAVREVPGVVRYDEDATEGWGVEFPSGAFVLDFDSTSTTETDADAACMDKVVEFVMDREES